MLGCPDTGKQSLTRDTITTHDQTPIQPIQDECKVWDEAGSRVAVLGMLDVSNNSSEANIQCDIDGSQVELWPTESDWDPDLCLGPKTDILYAEGSIDLVPSADMTLGTGKVLNPVNQETYNIPQAFNLNCASNAYNVGGPAVPLSMGVQNGYLDAQLQYNNVQATTVPNDYQGYIDQNSINWSNSAVHLGQANSMLSFPLPNNFANAGIPFGFPVYQRTPCTWAMCSESFARQSDLQRHVESVHLGIKYHCFWPGCANNRGNGYCRLEKLRTHQREKHGYALV